MNKRSSYLNQLIKGIFDNGGFYLEVDTADNAPKILCDKFSAVTRIIDSNLDKMILLRLVNKYRDAVEGTFAICLKDGQKNNEQICDYTNNLENRFAYLDKRFDVEVRT